MGYTMTKLDLKYVHKTINRHGKVYYSFRKKGCPRVRLPSEVGSTAFMEAYGRCLSDVATLQPLSTFKIKAGSMTALTVAWYASGEFKQLRASTQVTYRGIMGRFLSVHGDKPVAELRKKHVAKIIAEMNETPAAANNLLARLKQIMRFAVENDWVQNDPTFGVRKLRYRVEGFQSWTEAEAQTFMDFYPMGTKAHLAFMLLIHTGVRRSDVVRLGKGNVRGDMIHITQQKNNESVTIPISAALSETLALVKDRMIFLQTDYGKPFTAAGFGGWFRIQCNRAGLPVCSSHGLRKLIAVRLAEAGCNENSISAILGWANNKQASLYTKNANKTVLARTAMKAIS